MLSLITCYFRHDFLAHCLMFLIIFSFPPCNHLLGTVNLEACWGDIKKKKGDHSFCGTENNAIQSGLGQNTPFSRQTSITLPLKRAPHLYSLSCVIFFSLNLQLPGITLHIFTHLLIDSLLHEGGVKPKLHEGRNFICCIPRAKSFLAHRKLSMSICKMDE